MSNPHAGMANQLHTLMKAALDPTDKEAGLNKMLQSIANALDAYGCVLWEATPESKISATEATGHLFILASWFKNNDIVAMHDLPIVDSATGIAMREGQPKLIQKIRENGGSGKSQKFLERNRLDSMCTVPVEFADKRLGAINVYRQSGSSDFTEEDQRKLKDLGDMVPMLYQATRDKVSDRLIRAIDADLRDGIRSNEAAIAPQTFQAVCDTVQKRFNCLEVSLFWRSSKVQENVTLVATTWPIEIQNKENACRKDDGLTGWVLAERKIMSIFDLAQYERDKAKLHIQYPGHFWKDRLHLEKSVRAIMKLPPHKDLPPLSFLALPILVEDFVVGVLRCCTFLPGGPYYFSERDIKLLQIVTGQLAHSWNIIKNRRELREENDWWKQVVTRVNNLNDFVQEQVKSDDPSINDIFKEAIEAAKHLVATADLLSVRLLNESRSELEFKAIGGKAWNAQMKQKLPDVWERKFKVNDRSIAAQVISSGQLYHASAVKGDKFYNGIFPGIVGMMTAPITVGGKTVGVFDLRTTSQVPFSQNDLVLCDLLGRQLGLYCHLVENVGDLREAFEKEKIAQQIQAQMYEDLAHQLKGPVSQALKRSGIACEGGPVDRDNLNALRGLCRKARRVALTMGLLRDDTTQKLSLEALEYSRLMKFLVEAARDAEIMQTDPDFQLRFHVNRKSFQGLWYNRVGIDFDLLEQAVNNLLDNAGKYSFPDTAVNICGEFDHKNQRFKLAVANTGLPVTPEEAKLCMKRGWRGEDAKEVTGEGSGIGLWIVQKIMALLGGELEITPTNDESETVVRLSFRLEEGAIR